MASLWRRTAAYTRRVFLPGSPISIPANGHAEPDAGRQPGRVCVEADRRWQPRVGQADRRGWLRILSAASRRRRTAACTSPDMTAPRTSIRDRTISSGLSPVAPTGFVCQVDAAGAFQRALARKGPPTRRSSTTRRSPQTAASMRPAVSAAVRTSTRGPARSSSTAKATRDAFLARFSVPYAPTDISLSVNQVAERQPAGTVVGRFLGDGSRSW